MDRQITDLEPKCKLCEKEQLELCLAQLNLSERAKDSVRQLFASGEINPIIESYLQKHCVLDDKDHADQRDIRESITQLHEQVSAESQTVEEIKPAAVQRVKMSINVEQTKNGQVQPIPNPGQPLPRRPLRAVQSPRSSKKGTDELAEISTATVRVEPYILTVLDTQHRIRLPERGEFILGSWDALGSLHPDVNLVYDDRGQRSVSARHARISVIDNVYYIEDLVSEHGTWLNDEQLGVLKPVPFKLGDTLCLGSCVLQVNEVPGFWSDSKSVYTLYTTTNGREIALPRHGELVIGRNDSPAGFIPDIDLGYGDTLALGVSRQHMAIRCWMHTIEISDLGSTNGTELEGIRIPPGIWVSIRPGQHFNLGGFGMALQVRRAKTVEI